MKLYEKDILHNHLFLTLEPIKLPTHRENDITSLIIPAQHHIAGSNTILAHTDWTICTTTVNDESHGGYSINGGKFIVDGVSDERVCCC